MSFTTKSAPLPQVYVLSIPQAHRKITGNALKCSSSVSCLSGCNNLTDSCLLYLKRLSSLTLLDLRGCTNISRRACDAFISDLSHVALFCMMEEKLIQRLD